MRAQDRMASLVNPVEQSQCQALRGQSASCPATLSPSFTADDIHSSSSEYYSLMIESFIKLKFEIGLKYRKKYEFQREIYSHMF